MQTQAKNPMLSAEAIVDMMRENDVMPTQQRLMIARVLFARPRHLSAEQVMTEVNNGRNHVSKATVYNTLGLFAGKGLIREVIVDPTRVFYDPNTNDHHHFYNMDTGELCDVNVADVEISQLPEMPPGTVTAGVDVIIRVRNANRPAEQA